MVAETFTAPLYAPLADKFGRRTVLIPTLFGWGAFALAFGFATGPTMAVFWRGCRELHSAVPAEITSCTR